MPEKQLLKVLVKTKQPIQKYFFQDDVLYVYLKACPANNKANKELVKLLAKIFHTTQDQIIISQGLTKSAKMVKICR